MSNKQKIIKNQKPKKMINIQNSLKHGLQNQKPKN